MQFNLTVHEANIVLAALGKMPYEQVFEVVQKLQSQAQSQNTPEPE